MFKLLVCLLFIQTASIKAFAQKQKEYAKAGYSLYEIEHLIGSDSDAQIEVGYELGQVNFSRRTINTLAVGTHAILSPTGGWGEHDLESLAIKRAGQKLERLSTELYKDHLELSRCHWTKRSQLFQSQSPHWMSDGSIHLSSTIRFEVYEACSIAGLNEVKSKYTNQRLKDEQILAEFQIELTQHAGAWLRGLEKKLQQGSRQIVKLSLSPSTKAFDVRCLTPFPTLRTTQSKQDLSAQWIAVRWFWKQPNLSYKALYSRTNFAHDLGMARCSQQGEKLELLSPFEQAKLKKLIDAGHELELWIWVQP